MNINSLVNHSQVHDSPTAERFYRLQLQRQKPPNLQLPRSKELTRDQKVEIRTLRKYNGWEYSTIRKATGYTERQIQKAINGPLTPRKARGNHCGPRSTVFNTPQKNQIREALHDDKVARKLSWSDLRYYIPGFDRWGEQAFVTAMMAAGFKRRIQPRRLKLTDRHKAARLAFAYEQLTLRPQPEDWEKVLFSDETWATNNPMWKRWITIHDMEDIEAWALIRQKPHGWMFWGSIAGSIKGPSFMWEKEYGGITAEKYQHYIIPQVHIFLEGRNGFFF